MQLSATNSRSDILFLAWNINLSISWDFHPRTHTMSFHQSEVSNTQSIGGALLLAASIAALAFSSPGQAKPVGICGKEQGDVTVMAFGKAVASPAGAKAAQTVLELKIDRPARPELPGELALYEGRCETMAPLLAGLDKAAPSEVVGVYRRLGPTVHAQGGGAKRGGQGLRTFDLIVLSNPVAEHEADYNHWYDTQHMPEVLKIPGFETAQRFKLLSNATPRVYPLPRYAIRFVFHSADLQATADDIKHRLDTGVTHRSPYFDMGTSVSRYYAPISDTAH